jgi:hypothetical protein
LASVVKQASKYWIAAFRDSSGRQHRRTTRETDKKRALEVAKKYERAAKAKGNPQQVRKILSEFLRDHFGEELPFCHGERFYRPMAGCTQSGNLTGDFPAL